ncbi:MAG: hypothetical protein M1548_00155 [Actinobacteria bacterium]|nr:hypothetical protein [Actinomycetota bacterium]
MNRPTTDRRSQTAAMYGQPVGLQIIGPTFGEGIILNAAYAFEQALGFKERPSL